MNPTTTARFPRLEQRGQLLGLTRAQLALLAAAVAVFVLAEYGGGARAVAAAGPLWLLPAVVALLPLRGRPAISWVPLLAGWAGRRVTGAAHQHVTPDFTRRLSRRAGDAKDVLVVPGVSGLRLLTTPDAGAGAVLDRGDGTLTTVLRVHGRGFVLADPARQAGDVAAWARVLGALCQQPAVVRVQVLHRSVPGGSAALRAWWRHREPAAGFAGRVVSDLLAQARSSEWRCETLIAVRWQSTPRRAHGRGGVGERLRGVEGLLPGFERACRDAGLRSTGWATPAQLAAALFGGFDPAAVAARDQTAIPAAGAGVPAVAGTALVEAWGHVRTDSGVHAVYWVRQWPRSETAATFLHPLLASPGRALSLLVEPVPTGRALRDIRASKVGHAADDARHARWGRIGDHADTAEAADVAQRERDLAAGHGELRIVGLLTVTADTPDALDAACAGIETQAAQVMCELRRLGGQHAPAFLTAALPLARSAT